VSGVMSVGLPAKPAKAGTKNGTNRSFCFFFYKEKEGFINKPNFIFKSFLWMIFMTINLYKKLFLDIKKTPYLRFVQNCLKSNFSGKIDCFKF
jgi:hypothetical protein